MIELFLNSVDLVRILLGIFCGFFIGVWFSMSMQKCSVYIPEVKSYNWLTPKNYKDPYGNPRDEHSGRTERKGS